MLTVNSSIRITDNGVSKTLGVFSGLSTDAKPVFKIFNGSEFYEIDSGKVFRFDMETETWNLQPSVVGVIAEVYDTTHTYNKFALVIYQGKLYSALANNITGEWDATKWAETTVSEIMENLQKPFIFVDTLPATGVEGKVYFVPSADPKTGDVFEEFIWKDGSWERIGGVTIDLSNYYTKTETDSAVSSAISGHNSSNTAHSDMRTTLNTLDNKVLDQLSLTCDMVDGTQKTLKVNGSLT